MAVRAWGREDAWASPVLVLGVAAGLGLALGASVALLSPLVALAALLGVALVLAVLREPAFGLYGLLGLTLLLPFAVVPARLGVQLTALEAILGLTVGATLLRALARREAFRPDPIGWLLLGLLLLAGLSLLLSVPYTGSLAEVGRRFMKLMLAMCVFPLTVRLVRDRGRLDRLLATMMVLGALQGGLAVLLQLAPLDTMVRLLSGLGPLGYPTGPSVARFLPGENDTYTDVPRATGTLIDPNVLGGELMLVAGLLLGQLFSPRPLLRRWVLLPSGGLVVAAMLLSHSRSSWVGLALGLLALATLRYRKLWVAAIPAALVLSFLPVGRALVGRVLSGFAGQDKAAGMRLDEYRNAFEIILQHPLLGIGFGGPPTIDLAPGVSSLYLTVAETSGLPALALYLAALGLLLWRSLRMFLGRAELRLQSDLAGLLCALIAALVAGLFDHYFASTLFPHLVALFWLCCGLLWRATDLAQARTFDQDYDVGR